MKLRQRLTALLCALAATTGAPAIASDERIIELNGVLNTRDLGGLQTDDGRQVRLGRIIRSGELDEIDTAGMEMLDDIGVSTIIDLRTTLETANPAEWPEGEGPDRHNFYLMEEDAQAIENMRAAIKSGTAKVEDTEALFYAAFAEVPLEHTEEFRGLFDVLLALPKDEAVLVHCSGGKDRTGIATALILSALGVTQGDIEEDFLMSNVQKQAGKKAAEIAAEVNQANGTSMTPEAVWPSLGIRADHLGTFYDSVSASYGSIDGYLREGLGLTDEDLERLRDRYLD